MALHGACGKMGSRILALLPEFPDLKLVAALEGARSPNLGHDAGVAAGLPPVGVKVTAELGASGAEVLIDFSDAAATQTRLVSWGQRRLGLVVGTTGLSDAARTALEAIAKKSPVLVAPNMSRGANALMALATAAARLLPDWEAEIVEIHHKHKKDSPSGTALGLASAFVKGSPRTVVAGRPAGTARTSPAELTVHALRVGDVVGEHRLVLAGPGERIELLHAAQSRDAFARGALEAARFVARAKPGFYGMADVLAAR